MIYQVARLEQPMAVEDAWDSESWRDIEALGMQRFMGAKPEHFPHVQAKLAYDSNAIYAIFRVEDRYVRALAEQHQEMGCRDSCVESKEGWWNAETMQASSTA